MKRKKRFVEQIVFLVICVHFFANTGCAQQVPNNGTMMQYFEYFLPDDGTLWTTVKDNASQLEEMGIKSVWMPPAFKGGSSNDVGYTAYDLYDLGEFNQKSTIRTKYGTKQEYLDAIQELHKHHIQVYADVVFNHKGDADGTEKVQAIRVNEYNRNQAMGSVTEIEAWTKFNFPGRNNTHSTFKWRWYHFDGVNFDDKTKESSVFRFVSTGKAWDKHVDWERGNYDYLMHSDIDFEHPDVQKELKAWGQWYLHETDVDGFRIDAVKHIDHTFFTDWLNELRSQTGMELFAVGEYLSHNINTLHAYISNSKRCMSLFDFAMQEHFKNASREQGFYDLGKMYHDTLMKDQPTLAVPFVDNHDTQVGREGDKYVKPWFKPLAYTFIMTRTQGYPCLFYGDYYGIPSQNQAALKRLLDPVLEARKKYAYGQQKDYLDHHDIIGWTRQGDTQHPDSGLAALICDGRGGTKKMYIGSRHAGRTFVDITGNDLAQVVIDSDGNGQFRVNDRSWSIWVLKK